MHLLLLLLAACSKVGIEGEEEPTDAGSDAESCATEPTIESIHQTVFSTSCAFASSCHSQLDFSGRLLLACAEDIDGDGALDQIRESSKDQIQAACWNLVSFQAFNPNEKKGTLRVAPKDADQSYLVRKLEGRDLTANSNTLNCRMPYDACDPDSSIESCKIEAIKQWIENGAPGCEDPPPDVDVGKIDWSAYCENQGLP